MIDAGAGRLDVVVDDPPQPGVPLVDHPRDNGHRHRLHHSHDQRLEQPGKAAVRPRPGDRYLLDPALLAGDPRHPRMQVRFVLKEVQVPPGLCLTVVGRTARNPAFRAGEPAAPQPSLGQALAKSRWMSSRLAAASNSLFVTIHGGSIPSAIRNKSVSRIAAPLPERLRRASSWLRGAAPQPPGDFKPDEVPGVSPPGDRAGKAG